MIRYLKVGMSIFTMVMLFGGCGDMHQEVDLVAEKAQVEEVIKSSITWAQDKDKGLLYRCMVNDSTLFHFSPDSGGTIRGFDQFTQLVEQVFMNPAFKAIRADFRETEIHFSRSADVAWWSGILDDINEWNGRPVTWENVRWTGVLEKLDGQWTIMQMHFSYSEEDMRRRMTPPAPESQT